MNQTRILDTFYTDKGYQIERRSGNCRRSGKKDFFYRYERRIEIRRKNVGIKTKA